jgi:hypothetical protein
VTPVPDRSTQGSTLRLLIGATLTFTAVGTALVGFVRLINVLESGGYGTSAMRIALFILGAAGAMLAGGIATLIWEIAKRYESPREPEVRDGDPPASTR